MIMQQENEKSFFAKYWGWFAGVAAILFIGLVALMVFLYMFVLRGNVQVTDLSLSQEQIVSGDNVQASITMENKGVFAIYYTGTLMVDGEPQSLRKLEVKHSDPQTVYYDLSALTPGQHTIRIGEFSKQLKILKPANLKVESMTLNSDSVAVGSTITAKATISNSGEVDGTYSSKFTYDGTAIDSPTVKVEPGSVKTVEVEILVQAGGDHEISLDDQKQAFTALKPAKIDIVDLSLSKEYAKPNESISYTVTLENTGDVAGTYQLAMLVNGKSIGKQSISVEANTKLVSTFQLKESSAGKYVVKAGSLSKTFYVVSITRPANGTLLVKKANSGYGKITLVNGNKDKDALFVLASTSNPKAPLLTVYVRAGSKAANIKIKDGNYYIFYSTGTGFDSASKRFIYNASMSRFDDPIAFKTRKSGYTTYYSVWTVSLNVSNGNSSTIPVDDDNFPK